MEQLIVQNSVQLKQAFVVLSETLKAGPVDLHYRAHRRDKSKEQLGYYYGCVLPLLKRRMSEDGNNFSVDQIDAFLKTRFFSETMFNPISGETEKIVRMKRNSNVKEMGEYLTRVLDFCRENLGLHIPPADDYKTIKELGL